MAEDDPVSLVRAWSAPAAETVCREARAQGLELDYTIASAAALERLVADGLDPDLANAVGAYMAEVFIRELAGIWALNEDQGLVGIRFPSAHWAFPVNRAAKRFDEGPSQDLAGYLRGVAHLVGEPSPEALAAARRWDEAADALERRWPTDRERDPYGENVIRAAAWWEGYGDRATDPDDAVEALSRAHGAFALFASWSTSGSEGSERMIDVNRVAEKLAEARRATG